MSEEIRVWGIHTLNDHLFLKENVIAIGWKEMCDLSAIDNTRESYKSKFTEVYPDAKKGKIANGAGMLYRFVHELKIGDYIIFPSKSDRRINIGQITGDYKYDPEESEYVNKRDVKWLKHLSRTSFSQGALYEIGSALTFFSVKNYADEFLIHGIDVEGKGHGADRALVELLAGVKDYPITYAGGLRSLEDLQELRQLGKNRIHATVGSALDIYGGDLPYRDVVEFCRE